MTTKRILYLAAIYIMGGFAITSFDPVYGSMNYLSIPLDVRSTPILQHLPSNNLLHLMLRISKSPETAWLDADRSSHFREEVTRRVFAFLTALGIRKRQFKKAKIHSKESLEELRQLSALMDVAQAGKFPCLGSPCPCLKIPATASKDILAGLSVLFLHGLRHQRSARRKNEKAMKASTESAPSKESTATVIDTVHTLFTRFYVPPELYLALASRVFPSDTEKVTMTALVPGSVGSSTILVMAAAKKQCDFTVLPSAECKVQHYNRWWKVASAPFRDWLDVNRFRTTETKVVKARIADLDLLHVRQHGPAFAMFVSIRNTWPWIKEYVELRFRDASVWNSLITVASNSAIADSIIEWIKGEQAATNTKD